MYIIDTHVHTSETSPCGKIDGSRVARLYKEAGYHGIVITDHYYKGYFDSIPGLNWREKADVFLEGYRKARETGEKIGLTVLLGMEICFSENINDYLVYGISEDFLRFNEKLYNLSLSEFKKFSDKSGLLIFQAHPFRLGMYPADPQLLDGVEVYNGNPRHDSRNHLAYWFAQQNNLSMTSGSDFHQVPDLAAGGIVTTEMPEDSSDLVRLLKNGMVEKLIGISH